jgi:hypothetical protein
MHQNKVSEYHAVATLAGHQTRRPAAESTRFFIGREIPDPGTCRAIDEN